MRWGILGIGRVTPRMVDAIRLTPGHDVVAAAARNRDELSRWGTNHRVSQLTTDFRELCASETIDAIYIALPPHLHAEFALEAIRHGKTVLCEKPLTMSAKEAETLRDVANERQASIHHATGFPFHSRSIAMRETIRSGRLGKLHRVTIACSASHILHRGKDHRTDSSLGGGCLLDLGWYCAYATLWFTGLKPQRFLAMGQRLHGTGIWTSAQAIVQLSDNVVAHWDCGFDAAGRKWIEFAGSDASLICDDFLRPWDVAKPRYWIHGNDGKAASEIVGVDEFQEVSMVAAITAKADSASQSAFQLAVETQQILVAWESAMETPSID